MDSSNRSSRAAVTTGQKRAFTLMSVVFLVGAGLTAAYDLSISTRFVNQTSWWAGIIQYYGKIPGLLAALWGAVIVGINLDREPRGWRPLIACVLLGIGGSLFFITVKDALSLVPMVNVRATRPAIAIGLAGCVLLTGLAWALRRAPRLRREHVRRFGRVTVILVLLGNLVLIQGLKGLWGRMRFRDLPDLTAFTAWYLPQGHTGEASFPSGHTGMAWILLPLFLLVPREHRATRRAILAGVVVWSLVVAIGRVKIGAHYASDVLFASAIEIGVFVFALWLTRPQRTETLVHSERVQNRDERQTKPETQAQNIVRRSRRP